MIELHGWKAFPVSALLGFSTLSLLPNSSFADPAAPQVSSNVTVQWNDRGMPESLHLTDSAGRTADYAIDFAKQNRFSRTVHAVRNRFPFPEKISLNATTADFKGAALSDQFRRAIGQLEQGGLEFRTAETAEEFLAESPIANYDRDLGRSLAERFGIVFAQSIYKTRHLLDARNADFQARVASGPHDISASDGWLFFVVPGFSVGNADQSDQRTYPVETRLVKALKGLGRKVEAMSDLPFGQVEQNSALVESVIRQRMIEGEHIVIVTLSKGVPESVRALSRIHESPDRGATGRIEAIVTMSGLYHGSYIADWGSKNGAVLAAGGLLRAIEPFLGNTAEVLTTGLRLTREVIEPLVQTSLDAMGPGSVPTWLNFTSVPPHEGVAIDPGVRTLQERLVMPYFTDYGPSDGMIDLPDTVLPLGSPVATRRADMIVDASHNVWDGQYEGFILNTEAGMEGFVGGWIQLLVDSSWR